MVGEESAGSFPECFSLLPTLQLAKIERGKPFIRKRQQKKLEPESQGDLFAQEGRNTQEKSPM